MLSLICLSAATSKALVTVGTAAAGAAGGALVDRYGGRVVRGIGKGLSYVGRKLAAEGERRERSL